MDDLILREFGSSGLLIKFASTIGEGSLSRCRGLLRALRVLEVIDIVPAYGEILLEFRDADHRREAQEKHLPGILHAATPSAIGDARLREIPVIYDGPDLAALSRRSGLTVEEVIVRHSAPEYRVHLIGFSPGFPYLGPLDPILHAPRLASPRVRVPAGSVGIGGEHTGIYGLPSPGGWWLIGRTPVELYSPTRAEGEGSEDAFFLEQGDRVKFIPLSA